MAWTVPIQRASFKGVHFEVLSTEDTFERALVEHSYPFVNGADLEDMGLNVPEVHLSAIFFGEGYFTDLKKLLKIIEQPGSGVLVHPIRGRMPDMLLVSASLRHEADYVNYVALELTFKQSVPIKPIFVFESALVVKIDALLNQLDALIDTGLAFWAAVMENVSFANNVKARLLGAWTAIFDTLQHCLTLFDIPVSTNRIARGVEEVRGAFSEIVVQTADRKLARLSLSLDTGRIRQTLREAGEVYAAVLARGFDKLNEQHQLTPHAAFDEVLRTVATLNQFSHDMVTGKQQTLTYAQFARKQGLQASSARNLVSSPNAQDIQPLTTLLRLLTTAYLTRFGVEMIEAQADTLTPTDIEYITNQIRLAILDCLNGVRELQQQSQVALQPNQPTNEVYTKAYQTEEALRNSAHLMSQLAIAAINRKPPLRVRECELSGTIWQIAHQFYGDFQRADELLRLNPQIRQPNWVEQGTLLNSYAE